MTTHTPRTRVSPAASWNTFSTQTSANAMIAAPRNAPPQLGPPPGLVAPPPILDFATSVLGIDLDSKQAELLSAAGRNVILNCCRQWGKSTMAAVKAVHRSIERPGSLSIIVSPSERQSGELVGTIRRYCAQAGLKTKGDGRNKSSVVLENGSRVVGLPASERTTRGFANVALLIVDEASRVPDDVYLPMRPFLATSSGDIWLLSTPYGCKGFFYRTWTAGRGGWFRVTAKATECPRILFQG